MMVHPKTTAAMAAFYIAVAAVMAYFIRETLPLVAALLVLFSLVLLAGNMHVRAGAMAKRRDGIPPPPVPRRAIHDPEAGRR